MTQILLRTVRLRLLLLNHGVIVLQLLDRHARSRLKLCLAVLEEGACSLRVARRFMVVDVWTRLLVRHDCCILGRVRACIGHWMTLS